MALQVAELNAKLTADTSQFIRAMDGAEKNSRSRLGAIGGAIGGMAKTAAMVGGPAMVAFGAFAVKAFSEAQAVAAQTGAVLKSTGGIANVTAGDVENLAGSLSMLSGVDDEAIASGQNLLLTFTKVRNETGKGNKIFDKATKAALNMSVAMGMDLNSAVLMVGKSLNDPVAGMTAMQRAGIQFTKSQKDMIESLVASGDQLGAQKIILAELETQFGGSAAAAGETFAGKLAKLKVIAGNLMEEVGARLVPVIMKLAEWAADHIPAAMDKAGKAFAATEAFLKPIVGFVQDVIDRFRSFGMSTGEESEKIRGIFEQVKETFRSAFEAVKAVVSAGVDFLKGVWRVFGDDLTSFARESWAAITEVFKGAFQVLDGIFDLIKAVFTGKWGEAWNALKQIVGGVWDVIFGVVRNAVTNVIPTIIAGAGQGIASAFRTAFDGLKGAFQGALNWIIDKWNNFKIPGVSVMGVNVTPDINFPDLPRFHSGGMVPGPRGADVPIMAQAGETVTPAGGGGGGSQQPIVVQLVADGRVIQEILLSHQRRSGALGLT